MVKSLVGLIAIKLVGSAGMHQRQCLSATL